MRSERAQKGGQMQGVGKRYLRAISNVARTSRDCKQAIEANCQQQQHDDEHNERERTTAATLTHQTKAAHR